jgi:restriction system protein
MARRKGSIVEDLILAPWWVSLGLAVVLYPILSSAKAAAPLAPFISFVLIGVACVSAVRAWANRRMFERQTGIDSLRELSWKQFEDLLAEAYRRQGYIVKETLGGGADGGVDLVLSRHGGTTLVQCKRWKGKPVPVQIVRELFGILTDRGANAARLVATTTFTPEAVNFARGKPIELVNSDALLKLIHSVQTSGKIVLVPENTGILETPNCPKCASIMVLREARRGTNAGQSFWGCSRYPSCRGTREL